MKNNFEFFNKKILININDNKIRIDKYLFDFFKKNNFIISRNKIQYLIYNKKILVNNNFIYNNYFLKKNDEIFIKEFSLNNDNKIFPKKILFDILYEDNDLLIINKPNNIVVYPAIGHYNDTIVNGLLNLNYNIYNSLKKERFGIIHRIDRQTTGLLIIAKNKESYYNLQLQIKNKKIKKLYLAIVEGLILENKGKIIAPIGRDINNRKKMIVTEKNSKLSITHFFVIKRFLKNTFIKCNLITGRTHQIRVHFKYINYPILNDPVYNFSSNKRNIKNNYFGQYLHSYQIKFKHFKTGKNMFFEAPLPIEFKNKLLNLEKEKKYYKIKMKGNIINDE